MCRCLPHYLLSCLYNLTMLRCNGATISLTYDVHAAIAAARALGMVVDMPLRPIFKV